MIRRSSLLPRGLLAVLLPLCLALAACSRAVDLAPPPPVETESVKPGINDSFLAQDLDVETFIQRFEGESREIAANYRAIGATLELEPGMAVADVGAGTGLFLEYLSTAVGDEGTVYAVDLSPGFLAHLEERIDAEGWEQASVVHCTERSVELPESSVDVVFVCDTYHHFEYPQSSLWSIHRALQPGGRLVVVDFERIPGVTREWLMDHVRADKATFRSEIEAAGFTFEDEVEVDGLEENYLLRFRRP